MTLIMKVGDLIGRGGFGRVYHFDLIQDKVVQKFALKCISGRFCGIEGLIETVIMTQISHKHLMSAVYIDYDFSISQTKILQELADGNLRTLLLKKREKISFETRRLWIWQLITAISHLHSCKIAHGDIKSSNILLFNKTLKLGDFGMSAYIPNDEHKINGWSYTCSHRPSEIWEGKGWSLSADIWAFGCTIYEIMYRTTLFPMQTGLEEAHLNVEAQKEWIIKAEMPHTTKHLLPSSSSSLHQSCTYPTDWFKDEMKEFNRFLRKVLVLNPEKRLNIWEIAEDPFFDSVRSKIEISPQSLSPSCDSSLLSSILLQRTGMETVNPEIVERLVAKLLRIPFERVTSPYEVFTEEVDICKLLEYKLLPI